jgi:hypothetical protein
MILLNSVLVLLIRQGDQVIPGLPAGFQYPCPTRNFFIQLFSEYSDLIYSFPSKDAVVFFHQEYLHISVPCPLSLVPCPLSLVPCPSTVSTVAFCSSRENVKQHLRNEERYDILASTRFGTFSNGRGARANGLVLLIADAEILEEGD